MAAVDPYSIRLKWDDNSVDEFGFTISNGATEVTLGRDVTSYVWTSLVPETQMCFTLRAFNDVGRSRSAPDECATTPGAPTTAAVQVPSTAIWEDTGLILEPGQQLTIDARGSWTSDVEAPNTGPDGYPEPWPDNFLNLDDLGACPSCATTLTPGHGALVGYLGDAPPPAGSYTSASVLPEAQRIFMVGSSYTESVTEAGRLWLAFNTDAYSAHTADNAGMVSAEITVE